MDTMYKGRVLISFLNFYSDFNEDCEDIFVDII